MAKFKGKHLYRSLLLRVAGPVCKFIIIDYEVFSCEFCEISKDTIFTDHFQTTCFCVLNLEAIARRTSEK